MRRRDLQGHINHGLKYVCKQGHFQVERTTSLADFRQCAFMMSGSEPWITLRRTFADSLKTLQDPLKEVYVASEKGTIVSFMVLQMIGTFKGYIQSIYVDRDHRGQGIGTCMVRLAEERIFSETPNVFICVSSFNRRALRLYRRLKYEKVGILKSFIVSGHSEILLRKTTGSLCQFRKRTGLR